MSVAQSWRANAANPTLVVHCDLVLDLGTWKSAVSAKVQFWLLFIDPAAVSTPLPHPATPNGLYWYSRIQGSQLQHPMQRYVYKTVTADRQVTSIPEVDFLRVLLGRWTGTACQFVSPATCSTSHTTKRLLMKTLERILFPLLVFVNPLKRSEDMERVQAG